MPLESLFADAYTPKDRGLLALLKSVISDAASTLPPVGGNYLGPLKQNLEDQRPKPPVEFYNQVQTKLAEPQFHSRVLADILRSTDKPIYDAVQGPAALAFSSTPQGMALTQAAGIVGNPSLENIFATAGMMSEPGNAGLAASPIAKLHGLQRQAEELATAKGLQNARVNARNEVYHATDLEGFKGILEAGEIRPNEWLHMGVGKTKAKELMKGGKPPLSEAQAIVGEFDKAHQLFADKKISQSEFKEAIAAAQQNMAEFTNKYGEGPHSIVDQYVNPTPTNPESGVSVSRVPRIAPKSSKAISFVIDRDAMPPNRPLAEEGYRKTAGSPDSWDLPNELYVQYQKLKDQAQLEYSKGTTEGNIAAGKLDAQAFKLKQNYRYPNKLFEFEDRTYNTPIPLSHKGKPVVKEVWVDKSAMHSSDVYNNKGLQLRIADSPEYKAWATEYATKYGFSSFDITNPSNAQELQRGVELFITRPAGKDAVLNAQVADIRARAASAGLPVRVFDSGPQMHAARAGSYGRKAEGLSYGAHGQKLPVDVPPPPPDPKAVAALPQTKTFQDYVDLGVPEEFAAELADNPPLSQVSPPAADPISKMTSALKGWLGKQEPVNVKSKTPNVGLPKLESYGAIEVFDPKSGATKGYVNTEAEAKKFWDAYGWDYGILAE